MNHLDEWGTAYNIHPTAMADLKARMINSHQVPPSKKGDAESMVLSRVRLEASQKGCRLWRNNVGACTDENGNFIRYGLANDSKKMNDSMKSSDLVGIRPRVIVQEDVGKVIGQFMCREVKRSGWKWVGNKREQAQLAWINLINSLGGDADFCSGEGSI